ncbi:hypothetical protein [Paenibacillus sp. Y412MC10]|uniref:hypothetical protein n=1 Tax=Geobacillus sp. (strain Y412MC10) TaxID=481743 RepID=UPI0011AB722F|nr:hypothetical protein [Paenibacillus sp. Y412MC10]
MTTNTKTIDLSVFPKVKEQVEVAGIQNRQEYIIWNKLTKEETASALVELSLLCKASLSTSFSGRKRARLALNFYKRTVGAKVHPFAAAQAREDLGLSSVRMQELINMQMQQLSLES